jgi:hypothetical protein
MSLSDTLKAAGFDTALIVDDAFDAKPTAADLEMEPEAWSMFIADISSDLEHVERAFPEYRSTDANDLRRSDSFVQAMYGLRGTLRNNLWDTLFAGYERAQASDLNFLQKLEKRLKDTGLEVKKAGRSGSGEVANCNIIFADLFLGAAQQDFDVDQSINRLRTIMAGREKNPPAVVLMSRSSRLNGKKERFRDDAKLVGALFRVYQKPDLLAGATVETVLERLATHRADAVRVAAFLAAWEEGLAGATAEFMRLIRRLDLSDFSKIQDLLLDAEGQPLGSYMLDVLDRVLQHEIEGNEPTIAAAQELSAIDPTKYPTPYIGGSSDLQNLVVRVLWQHPRRLKATDNTAGMPVSFGDVLVRRSRLEAPQEKRPNDQPDVLVVLTPACDLVRCPDKRRVLLLGGVLKPLDTKTCTYKSKGAGMSIVQLEDQPRMSIEWDMDDQRMLNRVELTALLQAEGPYAIMIRMRESNALELQQQLLADMGRVGLISKMPFTFPVDVNLCTVDKDGNLQHLDLPITASDGGVCITGREGDSDRTRLILTEASVDEILSAIPKIKAEDIPERSRETLKRLQASTSFRTLLTRGLDAPAPTVKGVLSHLKVPSAALDEKGGPRDEIVGLIVRNPPDLAKLQGPDLKNSSIVLMIRDLEPEGAVASKVTRLDDAPATETETKS